LGILNKLLNRFRRKKPPFVLSDTPIDRPGNLEFNVNISLSVNTQNESTLIAHINTLNIGAMNLPGARYIADGSNMVIKGTIVLALDMARAYIDRVDVDKITKTGPAVTAPILPHPNRLLN